jgi:ferric-dicitrate binding protein FerR (iron transport regulator)
MWLDDRTLELIQLTIDGEATESDRAELDAILTNSAQARAMYEAMRDVARQLDAVPMAEPPHVRPVVMEKIRSRTVWRRPPPAAAFRRRTVLAVIYAVAAAIVIGVGVDRLLVERVRPQESAASMVAPDVNDWPLVTRTADVTVRALGDRYAVQPRNGVVDWDHRKLEIVERRGSSVILQRRQGATGSAMIRLSIVGREVFRTPVGLDR